MARRGVLDWVPARVKWLWAHDTFVHRAPLRLSLADRVLALSERHRGKLVEQFPVIAEKISVTRERGPLLVPAGAD